MNKISNGQIDLKQNGTAKSASLGHKKQDSADAGRLEMANHRVSFDTPEGMALTAALHEMNQLRAVFHLPNLNYFLQVSESLKRFQIIQRDQIIYSGGAVIANVTDAGSKLACEVILEETGWVDLKLAAILQSQENLAGEFQVFMQHWKKSYNLSPDFKLAIVDMKKFLINFRAWLGKIEKTLNAQHIAKKTESENDLIKRIKLLVAPAFNSLFERFEVVTNRIPKTAIPEYRAYCHQQLHDLLLDSPFTHRIYSKPMGYAGDHEMIDMIIRNQYEGKSLFSKLLHSYILDQAPAISVRNRAIHFTRRFVEESSRVSRIGRVTQICSLGCGPAREVEKFLTESAQSNKVNFRLLDFSQETLNQTSERMERVKKIYGRTTSINLVRKSAQYLLKENKPISEESGYDLIYCSGLYDYLSNRVCKSLNTYLYNQLLPGGALVVTNFDPSNPIRNMMEFIFEWFLIHRDSREMAELAPDHAPKENCRVVADTTGCNVFLEVRKPL